MKVVQGFAEGSCRGDASQPHGTGCSAAERPFILRFEMARGVHLNEVR